MQKAISPIQLLEPFRPQIQRTRVAYCHEIATLPEPFRSAARDSLEDRIRRIAPRPLFGEYAPWMLVDILRLRTSTALDSTVVAWLYVYFSILLLDDIFDSRIAAEQPKHMMAASLLLQRGLCRMIQANHQADFGTRIDQAFADAGLAAVEELTRHRGIVSPYSQEGVKLLGRKSTVLRVCVDAMVALADENDSCRRWLTCIFDELLVALQLLDDLADWEEDYDIDNMTLPLTLAATREPHLARGSDKAAVLAALLKTQALEESLQLASDTLDRVTILLAQRNEAALSCSCSYIRELKRATDESLVSIRQARERFPDSDPNDAQELLERVAARLQVVAQST